MKKRAKKSKDKLVDPLLGGNDTNRSDAEWPPYCPSPEVVDAMLLLQERWVLFIVHALLVEPLGFNELSRRATGVGAATLAQRLILLEEKGVLLKQVLSTMPPRTMYRLTEKGKRLQAVIDAIEIWAARRR